MIERDFSDEIVTQSPLSELVEERMKQIKEAVERLMEGKIKSITIFRNGPIQER